MSGLPDLALDASVRIVLVVSCVGAFLNLLRVRSGALRHAGWTAVLCATLLMPVLTHLTPEIAVRLETPAMRWESGGVADTDPMMPPQQTVRPRPTPALPVDVPPSAIRSGSHSPRWSTVALAVYLAGLILLLAIMAAGWHAARRMVRAAAPVSTPLAGVAVYQSGEIAAPLIVGVLRPRILLPPAWRAWSGTTLRAVLAHEQAHLRRRDTLIALLAGLNRSVFWFHPLAWWLQRTLAATAEQACDDAGVRAMGRSREYAEVLLEMAEAVRCQGGRLSWQGVGMDGTGSLQHRIDRILSGDAERAIPRRQKLLVAAGCAAAIFFSAACRQAAKPNATAKDATARSLDSQESYRLGGFYAAVLMKLPEAYSLRNLGPGDYSSYAAEIRKRLDRSQDLTLLLETSGRLLAWGKTRQKATQADFDLFAFGKALVQRALQIDPKSAWAHEMLNVAADQEMLARLPESVWQGPLESRRQAIQALPDGERFRELATLAIAAGDVGFRADRLKHDAVAARAAWQQAGGYAREALEIAPKAQSHPDYGTAFFQANMVLGMEAVQNGDPKAATSFLLKAGEAPATDALKYPIPNARPWPMNWHFPSILAAALLKAGQRDAVVEFLESYARITVAGRDRCLEDITLIRQGKMPSWAGS